MAPDPPVPISSILKAASAGWRGAAMQALTARVCDALEQIDYVMGLSLFSDVPAALSPLYEFIEMMENSTKPVLALGF